MTYRRTHQVFCGQGNGQDLLPVLQVHVQEVLQLLLDSVHLALNVHDPGRQAQLAVISVFCLNIYMYIFNLDLFLNIRNL